MATMTAAAVITAVDRASPVFHRVAAAAQAAANRYTGVAGRIDAATSAIRSSTTAMALPAAAAFAGLIQRTQDFEKALVGVQIANIADNLKDGVVDFEKIRESASRTKEEAIRLSKVLSLSPTGFVKAGEAALKMGLAADKVDRLMEMSGSVHLQDRQISQDKAAEFLGTTGILFGAGKNGDYNDDITKYANQWLGVANMTRTSASKLEEGLRQFGPLYSSLGESFLDTAALVGAMTQAGQLDVESGTALKSIGTRMLNMTHKGRDAAVVSGFAKEMRERGLIDYSAVTAKQSLLNLKQVLPGQIKKGDETELRQFLEAGEKGKLFTDESWQNQLFAKLNRITGAKDAPSREAVQDKALTAILTGGGKIKMTEILQLMAQMHEEGRLTDAHLANIAEGRHLSKYKALFKMMPELRKLQKALGGVNDEFTKAGNKLWTESEAGRWEGAVAAVDRALIRLRGTAGVQSLTGGFEGIANFIADMPKGMQEAGGTALAASIGLSALGLALNGIARAGTLLAANPVLRALLIGGGLAYATAPEIFKGYGDFGEEIMFGPGAPIWDTFNKLKTVGTEIGGAFGDIFKGLSGASGELNGFLGIDPSASPVLLGLRAINAVLDGMTVSLRYWRTNAPLILGGKGADALPPGDPNSTWRRANEGYGRIIDGLRKGPPMAPDLPPGQTWWDRKWGLDPSPASLAPGQEPPRLGLLRDLMLSAPQRVDVQGQADVRVQSEVTVRVEGPGTVVDQRGGQGQARVPLNPGKTMPDTGYVP